MIFIKIGTGSPLAPSTCIQETASFWTMEFLYCPFPFTYCRPCCRTLTLLPCLTSVFSQSLFPCSDCTFLPFSGQSRVEGLFKKRRDFMDRKTIPWWATASTSKKVGKRKSSSLRTPNILTAFLSLLSPSTCPLPKPLSFQSLLITYRRLPNDTDEKGRDNQHVLSTGIFLSPSSSTPSHPLQPLSSKPTLLRPFHSPRVFLFPNCRIPIPAQMDST